ncbi:MAG: tyrosine-type recombinase/integrase [Polyangiaceae bacterium]
MSKKKTKSQNRVGPFRLCGVYRRGDNGRWAFNYRDESGRRRAKLLPEDAARTKAQAERAAREELRCLAERRARGDDHPETLADYLAQWLRRRASNPRVRVSTRSNNKSHVDHYVLPTLGSLPLEELRPRRVRDWLCDLRDGGRLKANSVRNVYATLKKALDGAVDEELIPSNPARAGIVRDELPPAELRYGDQLVWLRRSSAELLCTSDAVPHERRARWLVALTSGLREGELQGLRWEDVDLDGDVPLLDVHRSFTMRRKVGALKTASARRRVPLHPEAVQALRTFKREVWPVIVGRHPRPHDPVFANAQGNHWRPRSAEHIRRPRRVRVLDRGGRPTHRRARHPADLRHLAGRGRRGRGDPAAAHGALGRERHRRALHREDARPPGRGRGADRARPAHRGRHPPSGGRDLKCIRLRLGCRAGSGSFPGPICYGICYQPVATEVDAPGFP